MLDSLGKRRIFDVISAINDETVLANNLMRSPLFGRADATLHVSQDRRFPPP